jgi:hypothetical protein
MRPPAGSFHVVINGASSMLQAVAALAAHQYQPPASYLTLADHDPHPRPRERYSVPDPRFPWPARLVDAMGAELWLSGKV